MNRNSSSHKVVLAVGIVALVAASGLSFLSIRAASGAFRRGAEARINNAQAAIVMASENPSNVQASSMDNASNPAGDASVGVTDTSDGAGNDSPSSSVSDMSDKLTEKLEWNTDQIEWAILNHIKWNDEGIPIDENGNPVDDPTTERDEGAMASAKESADASSDSDSDSDTSDDKKPDEDESPKKEDESATKWWKQSSDFHKNDNGEIEYTVKTDDTIFDIAEYMRTNLGVKIYSDDIIDYNKVDPKRLHGGDVLRFPKDLELLNSDSSGKGLG